MNLLGMIVAWIIIILFYASVIFLTVGMIWFFIELFIYLSQEP